VNDDGQGQAGQEQGQAGGDSQPAKGKGSAKPAKAGKAAAVGPAGRAEAKAQPKAPEAKEGKAKFRVTCNLHHNGKAYDKDQLLESADKELLENGYVVEI